MRASSSFRPGRAAVPALVAIAYLAIASSPCPQPRPDELAAPGLDSGMTQAHTHGDAAPSDGATVLTALCLCGCEHGSATTGVARSGEAVMPSEPAPLLGRARPEPRELAQRIPDAPISVDSPVPIAA